MPRKISIGSWAYAVGPYAKNPVPLNQVVSELAKLGFDGVSMGGFKPHAHPDLYPGASGPRRIKDLLFANRLEVVEFSPDFGGANPLLRKEDYLAAMRRNIEFMDACGFHILRVDTGGPPILPDGVTYDQAFGIILEVFQELCQLCAARHMSVTWEFEPGFLFNKPSEVLKMLNAVDRDNFNIMFDTCHAHMCGVVGARQMGEKETLAGGVKEFIDMLAGKIGVVHLIDSDNTLHNNETSTHAKFGAGFLDFDQIIPHLLTKGQYVFDWWVIDLCFWPDAWRVTAECKEFMDNLNLRY
ncbi:MAG: sugar phosphate isomerase/epimerase [Planctomycetota bacterium]|jgi:sugar phosphate isomerase/epimerase|nr:sugar phosphate isomerase/epimerase [Planctomycetota bacterium]